MQKNVRSAGTSSGFGRLKARIPAEAGHRVFATMRAVIGKNAGAAREIGAWPPVGIPPWISNDVDRR